MRPHISRQNKCLRICGEQLRDPFSAAVFSDADNPLTAAFSRSTASFEITVPAERLDDNYYIDIYRLGIEIQDPDCINGYLILSPRTVNLISALITEKVLQDLSLSCTDTDH